VNRLALVLVVLLAAGCAGMGGTKRPPPPPNTLSHAQFVRAVDGVCAQAHRRGNRIPKPTNYGTLVKGLHRVVSVLEMEVRDLRALAPPPSQAATFQQLLDTLDRQDLTANHLLDAVEAREVGRIKALFRRVGLNHKRLRSLARKLDLRTCAKH
jgi:hypothetical protein